MATKAKAKVRAQDDVQWDQIPLSERRAGVLAEQAGLDARKLVKRSPAELEQELRFRIDQELLLFRRVCGRVVKRNPITGVLEPVANATVHVEDTDCRFLGFFPIEHPYFWLFPLNCYREEIASVTTDACGHFCVYIPRWEIDYILRLRLQRRCYVDIFRPNLADLLDKLRLIPKPKFPPGPDPGPLDLAHSQALTRVVDLVGPQAATALVTAPRADGFGAVLGRSAGVLDAPAFSDAVPPPLPVELEERGLASMAAELGEEGKFDRARFVGPFLRCVDTLVAEWEPVFDVPDITFRVTQDVDLDGDEETIYDEGFFDVRWNAGAIPDVTLIASAAALSTPSCDRPQIECQDVPAIRTAGLMPLEAPYEDTGTGFILRTNQPRTGGLSSSPRNPPAQTPFCLTLQLHGCHHIGGAVNYRLLYEQDGASAVPFTGLEWWAPKIAGGAPFHVTSDPDGWLEILPAAELVFPNWLLNWETWRYANARYNVTLQVGDAAKSPIATSAAVALAVDNLAPSANMTISWRVTGTSGWTLLPELCPVIRRNGHSIEVLVQWSASATHFLNAEVFGMGCNDGAIARAAGGVESDFQHWHETPADNAYSASAVFSIPSTESEGAYTFGVNAYSRAYNPAGSDAGPGTDFIVDQAYIATYPRKSIAVVG